MYVHTSPWAVEPRQDVMVPYSNPPFGYVAFGIVFALIAPIVIGSMSGVIQ